MYSYIPVLTSSVVEPEPHHFGRRNVMQFRLRRPALNVMFNTDSFQKWQKLNDLIVFSILIYYNNFYYKESEERMSDLMLLIRYFFKKIWLVT
jgi:hypothetical protein